MESGAGRESIAEGRRVHDEACRGALKELGRQLRLANAESAASMCIESRTINAKSRAGSLYILDRRSCI